MFKEFNLSKPKKKIKIAEESKKSISEKKKINVDYSLKLSDFEKQK